MIQSRMFTALAARPGAGAAIALLVSLAPAAARGQANGVRAGKFRLHPEARVGVRYDNNIYREDVAEEGPTGAAYVRLLPGLRLENPHPGPLAIDGGVSLEIRQYLDSLISDQQSKYGFQAMARAVLGPDQPIRLFATEDLRRQLEIGSGYSDVDADQLITSGLDRDMVEMGCAGDRDGDGKVDGTDRGCTFSFLRNETKVGLLFAPGGGRLTVEPSYKFALVDYTDMDTNDNTLHELALAGKWGFFPKTTALLDASVGFRSYADLKAGSRPTVVQDLMPVRATAGLRGLVTNKVSLDLGAGYGGSFAESGDDFSGVIGRAELRYALTDNFILRAGYRRSFSASSLANYVATHAIVGDVKLRLGSSLFIVGDASMRFMDYAKLVRDTKSLVNFGTDERSDTLFLAGARAEWYASDWLDVKVGWRMDQLGSDWKFVDPATGQPAGSSEYARHQVFANLGVSY